MKVATVLESSLPDSMMRRQRGMISVVSKKLMTSCSSVWKRNGSKILTSVKRFLVYLDQCSHNSQACQSEVLKWPRFAHSVKKGVEK